MVRLVAGFAFVLVLALGAAWLADQPGQVALRVGAYEVTTSLLVATAFVIVLALVVALLWRSYYWLTGAPDAVAGWFRDRGRRRGYDALVHGLIDAGAGDAAAATRELARAEKHLGESPLTLLLKAETAELKGEAEEARRAYKAMLDMPDTEALGLRGLYLEARRQGDHNAARALAERAVALNASLNWASAALFELRAAGRDWAGAREVLDLRRRHRQIERKAETRARAVLFTAEAQEADDAGRHDAALEAAIAAHRLAPDLVPAAAIAARIHAERGEPGRAAKTVERTWRLAAHPDLATVYTHVRPGDSTQDRLKRARQLRSKSSGGVEGAIAVARAAIDAREWDTARQALARQVEDTPTRRVCMLMAEIENGEHGDRGRVRQWLAQAVTAPRDPAWVGDGHVSERWLPVSPVTGAFDVYEWKVPADGGTIAAGSLLESLSAIEETEADEVVLTLPGSNPEAGPPEPPSDPAAETADPPAAAAGDGASEEEPGPAAAAPLPPDEPAPRVDVASETASDPDEDGPAAASAEEGEIRPPLPDDPGVDGDDYEDAGPRPRDLDGR